MKRSFSSFFPEALIFDEEKEAQCFTYFAFLSSCIFTCVQSVYTIILYTSIHF